MKLCKNVHFVIMYYISKCPDYFKFKVLYNFLVIKTEWYLNKRVHNNNNSVLFLQVQICTASMTVVSIDIAAVSMASISYGDSRGNIAPERLFCSNQAVFV